MKSSVDNDQASRDALPVVPRFIEGNSFIRQSSPFAMRNPACDVLVLDARARQSLVTVRSLGSRRLRVATLETYDGAPAFSSRWCVQKYICPADEGTEEYLTYLEQALDATRARVLISVSDGTIELIRRHRERLERRVHIALAKEPGLGKAINKEQTLEIANQLGLGVPRGITVRDVSEVEMALREIGLPAVIKPIVSWLAGEEQSLRVACQLVTTPEEARRAVEELTSLGGAVLFQQFLSGKRESLSFFYANGTIYARFAQLVKRTDPPLGGTDVLRRSIAMPADLGEQAERLVREIELEGYCLIEFRRDSAGKPYLMEINSRLSAGVELAVRAGVDFPYLLYQWASGNRINVVPGYRTGTWMRFLWGDIAATAACVRERGRPGVTPPARAILDFCTSFFVPMKYDYLDWSDPLPARAAIVGRARGGIKHLKNAIPAFPRKATTRAPTRTSARVTPTRLEVPPRRLEQLIAACFFYSGLVKLARWWIRRTGPKLIILCYHHAAGKNFRQQLLYLSRHYRILHLEAALEELYKPQKDGPQRKEQRTLLALTFDDGYFDNYTDGLAAAREMQIPMTVFLIPGYIESGERFWWQEPDQLLLHAKVREATIDGHTYDLDKADEQKALIRVIEARLRLATSVAEREAFLVAVRKVLAVASLTYAEEKPGLPLSWSEVHEMEDSSWISFGGHTMRHPILGYLADAAEAEYEVCESRVELERQLKHPVRTFAYPFGRFKHIEENGLRAVRAAKYDWAVTTIHGFNTPQTEPHLLHRILVGADQHWPVVAAKTCGVWEFFLRRAKHQEDLYG